MVKRGLQTWIKVVKNEKVAIYLLEEISFNGEMRYVSNSKEFESRPLLLLYHFKPSMEK